jgi:hypothetical protein
VGPGVCVLMPEGALKTVLSKQTIENRKSWKANN